MQVDKNKLELQVKKFQRVVQNKSTINYENRIIDLDKELSHIYEKATNMENILKIRRGGYIENPTEAMIEEQRKEAEM